MENVDMIRKWIDGFIRDCRVRDLSPFTVEFYRGGLANFEAFAASQDVNQVTDISADLLRAWLLELEARGNNPGGRHAKFRAVRAFLRWYQAEAEPEKWDPLAKIRAPRVTLEPIQGVSIEAVKAMLAACPDTFMGYRDKAIILCLLDTGARAREFLSLDLADVDTIAGAVILRKTKGRRPRTVFLGKRSRKALRAYLKMRDDHSPALWVTSAGDRLAYKSLQGMLERRAIAAGIDRVTPHSFRRGFALAMLRAGVDIFSIQLLLGHSDLSVLRRYLAQDATDLQNAFERASPADRIF